ncbi:uncharacterized protein [Clytia hemisphaerica]|uniref:uncharacterized protein n=1 Tax=Clytia hemisphaerica TaxID=252671 RepID=UPI0034D3D167
MDVDVQSETCDPEPEPEPEPDQNADLLSSLHQNPEVGKSVGDFLAGENNHDVATCSLCKETRPVYNPSFNNNTARVKLNTWNVKRTGLCYRCSQDRYQRNRQKKNHNKKDEKKNGKSHITKKNEEKKENAKQSEKPAKFSGYLTTDEKDLGPPSHPIRHNGMHFLPIPPFLQNLTMVERLLIAKITVCTNVHLLRHGMLSSKGHTVSIPNKMEIARHLPQLPDKIGVIVLKRKNQNTRSRQYAVKRDKVEQALKGLCFGYPNGGYDEEEPGTTQYDGPNCMNVQLTGKYFQYLPNKFYADVIVHQERIDNLPSERAQMPGLQVEEVDDEMTEDQKGPAPNQFFIPFDENDDSVTTSGITCPVDPQNVEKEFKMIVKKLTGSEEVLQNGGVASADWDHNRQDPIKELKTPGYFTMVAPDIFINAENSCVDQEAFYQQLLEDKRLLRKTVLENQHITTHYFAARTINYYNTVMRTLLQSDTFWFRFEFAKGRGQIHSHGVLFSEQHAKIVEDCLNCSEEDKANQLYNWLQSETNNTDEIFSPMFTSLHPAGGSEVIGENGEREWIPNKEGWAPPEGTRNPPEYDPLGVPILQTCNEENDLNELHTDITNMVALHSCNGYCLKKKNKDSERRYCRAHFGKEDPTKTKRHPAKNYTHSKLALKANCDCQALIDQDLLNLVKYICSYCCKGATTTEEFVTIYGELLHSSDISTTIKNVAQRLLMKVVGVVDVPAAAADFINTGGHLYHSTNLTQRVGLSGYRQLNSKKSNGSEYATVETPLDKFLRQERREEDPEMTLYDWAKKCRCNYPCGRTWESPEDLKDEDEQFSDALAAFLNDDPDCPDFLKEIIYLSKLKYDKKQERERRRNRNRNDENQIQESQDVQLSQPASQDSQQSSQDSNYNDLRLGEALLRDIRLNNNVNFDSIIGEANLFDGGPEFDWNAYAKECFGSDDWPENTKTWLQDKYEEVEERIATHLNNYNLPVINLLYANPLQRVIIAMNLEKLLSVAAGTDNSEPLRLLVQGYGGTGKTFTINAITYITRRLFRRNGSTLNIAPTGAASNLIPDGRTLHSTTQFLL